MTREEYQAIHDALLQKGYKSFTNEWEVKKDSLSMYDTSYQKPVCDDNGKRYYVTVDAYEGIYPSTQHWTRFFTARIQLRKHDGMTVDVNVHMETVEHIEEAEKMGELLFTHGAFPYYE